MSTELLTRNKSRSLGELVSNSIVVYLRLLTSAEIKTNPDYAAFLFHPETGEQMDPELFCNNFVEAVGKEAGALFSCEET